MGSCIICGTSTDGPICEVHQEDVVFEFEGNQPSQLTPGRFYVGSVDGYADFGVFINIGSVTGLLHRSKLDRRLESLDWEVGEDVCVQVNNVRDNGDIDLNWSIRETPADFRGQLRQTPDGDELLEGTDDEDDDEDGGNESVSTPATEPEPEPEPERDPEPTDDTGAESAGSGAAETDEPGRTPPETDESGSESDDEPEPERVTVETLEDRVGETV